MGIIVCALATILIIPIIFEASAQDRVKLRAVANEALRVSFVADEKGLRKLNEVIKKRIAEKSEDSILQYVVTFSDHSYYETSSIDVLLQEENSPTRPIVSVEMRAIALSKVSRLESGPTEQTAKQVLDSRDFTDTETPRITVTLSELGLSYSIKGADRDWVFNTQSDVSERFRNMANVVHPAKTGHAN